jgi:hypothetical protein
MPNCNVPAHPDGEHVFQVVAGVDADADEGFGVGDPFEVPDSVGDGLNPVCIFVTGWSIFVKMKATYALGESTV